MAKSPNLELVQQELKAFRSQLFKIDVDDESSKQELKEILDKYLPNHFEAFAEEYLIAGLDTDIVREAYQFHWNHQCYLGLHLKYHFHFFFSSVER